MYLYKENPLPQLNPSETTSQMNARFNYSNLCRIGSGITANCANAYFPVANILGDSRASQVWRSGTPPGGSGGSTPILTIDVSEYTFSNSVQYDLLIYSSTWSIYKDTLTVTYLPGNTTQTITPATSSWPTAAPDLSYLSWCPLTIPVGTTSITLTWTGRSGGYSLANYVEVSKLFIGPRFDTAAFQQTINEGSPDSSSWARTFAEYVNKDLSILGQNFAEKRAQYFQATWDLPLLSEQLEEALEFWFWKQGTFNPMWTLIAPGFYGEGPDVGNLWYVKATVAQKKKMVTMAPSGFYWSLPISFTEVL